MYIRNKNPPKVVSRSYLCKSVASTPFPSYSPRLPPPPPHLSISDKLEANLYERTSVDNFITDPILHSNKDWVKSWQNEHECITTEWTKQFLSLKQSFFFLLPFYFCFVITYTFLTDIYTKASNKLIVSRNILRPL